MTSLRRWNDLEEYRSARDPDQELPVALPPFATKIIEKLQRVDECAEADALETFRTTPPWLPGILLDAEVEVTDHYK